MSILQKFKLCYIFNYVDIKYGFNLAILLILIVLLFLKNKVEECKILNCEKANLNLN